MNLAGKLWNLPNTLVGLALGFAGHAFAVLLHAAGLVSAKPSICLGNNAIQFLNSPCTPTAVALGNVILYNRAPQYQPDARRGDHTLGCEEMQHTRQGEVLGPLYLPAHIVLGVMAMVRHRDLSIDGWHRSPNFLEAGPHRRTPSPWPIAREEASPGSS